MIIVGDAVIGDKLYINITFILAHNKSKNALFESLQCKTLKIHILHRVKESFYLMSIFFLCSSQL